MKIIALVLGYLALAVAAYASGQHGLHLFICGVFFVGLWVVALTILLLARKPVQYNGTYDDRWEDSH